MAAFGNLSRELGISQTSTTLWITFIDGFGIWLYFNIKNTEVIKMLSEEEYAEKRIRAILKTVLPGYRATFEGIVLQQRQDELLLIIERLLPKQKRYTKSEILREFYGAEAPLICNGDAFKIVTESVAKGGVAVIDVKIKRPTWREIQPVGS